MVGTAIIWRRMLYRRKEVWMERCYLASQNMRTWESAGFQNEQENQMNWTRESKVRYYRQHHRSEISKRQDADRTITTTIWTRTWESEGLRNEHQHRMKWKSGTTGNTNNRSESPPHEQGQRTAGEHRSARAATPTRATRRTDTSKLVGGDAPTEWLNDWTIDNNNEQDKDMERTVSGPTTIEGHSGMNSYAPWRSSGRLNWPTRTTTTSVNVTRCAQRGQPLSAKTPHIQETQ
jgi:hypothetical protein